MIPVDIGHVFPKTGLDADIRLDTKPRFVSSGSLFLPGGSTDDVEVDGLRFTSDGAWSTALWMRSDDFGTGKIWDLRNSSSAARLTFEIDGNDITVFHTGIGSAAFTGAASHIEDGTWHHVALSGAVSGSDNVYTLYIDGQQFGAASSALARIDISLADQGYIGNIYTGSGAPLTGNIAHLGFWNTDLEQAEIRALMGATTYAEAVTKSGNTPAAYYLFEADADASVGSPDGQRGSNAAIVGDSARLPRGADLSMTSGVPNRMDARLFGGRAVNFDGTGDFINCGTHASSQIGTGVDFSVSYWAKTSTTSGEVYVFTRRDDHTGTGYDGWRFGFNNGMVRYNLQSDAGSDDSKEVNSTKVTADGMWHFYAFTIDRDGNWICYIDGKADVTVDGSGHARGNISPSALSMGIGAAYVGGTEAQFFTGSVSDVKLYKSTILTAAQVLEQYQNPEQILPTDLVAADLDFYYPLADYDLESANSLDGLYFQDLGAAKTPGLASNCGMVDNQPCIPDLGMRSSRSAMLIQDDEIVTVSSHAGINIFSGADGGGSVAFWALIQSDGESDHGRILSKGGDYELMTRNESSGTCELKLEVPGFGGGTAAHHSAKTVNIGQWNHVVMTYTGLYNANPIFYINGATASNTTDTQTTGTFTDSGDLVFGNQAAGSRSMDGILSEVALWSSILDADAIAVLYASGVQGFDPTSDSGNYDVSSDLTGYWKLDNPTTIADLSTNSNTGAVTGAPTIVVAPEGTTAGSTAFGSVAAGRPAFGWTGRAMTGAAYGDLNENAYFELPHFEFGSANWTVSFWFKPQRPIVQYQRVASQYGTGGKGFEIYFGTTTRLDIYVIGDGGTASETYTDSDGWHDIWHHFVLRREGASTTSFYCRGAGEAKKADGDSSTSIGDLTSAAKVGMRFGTLELSSVYAGGVSIAFPRVWVGDAITDTQCDALHEQGKRFLIGNP